jgi:paraquat-inducible protein A
VSSVIACHACDLVHRRDPILARGRVRCVRCGAELYRTNDGGLDAAIAYAVCALVLFVLANAFPLVALKVNGTTRAATLVGAAVGLYRQGYASIALLVGFTTFFVPLAQILTLLYGLVPLRFGDGAGRRGRRGPRALFRMLAPLRPWGMAEVFVLGSLVALVKLAAMAQVIPGIALFSYGLLMITLAALSGATPTEQLWRWVDRGRQ